MQKIDHCLFLFHFITVFIVSYVVIRYHGNIYIGLDGTYILTLVKNQHEFMSSLPFIGSNFLQSQGNIFFPINTYFVPEYLFFHIFNDGIVDKYLAATFFCVELFFATLFLSICLGHRPLISILSGWLVISIIVYSTPSAVYQFYNLIPNSTLLISYTLIIITCYLLLGRYDRNRNIGLLILFLLLLFVLIISHPLSIILCGFIILLFMCVIYYFSGRNEKVYKKTAVISALLMLILTGVPFYFLGLMTYSTTWFFPDILSSVNHGWQSVSILFGSNIYNNYTGPVLWVAGITSAIVLMIKGNADNKTIAIGVIILSVLCLLLGLKISLSPISYSGPQPIYIERMIWPVYAIFTVVFIGILIKPIVGSLRQYIEIEYKLNKNHCVILSFLSPLLIPAIVIANINTSIVYNFGWKWPIEENELTEFLEEKIGISNNNSDFRGRVLNIVEMDNGHELAWYRQHGADYEIVKTIGNDMRLTGMWYFNIPTLVEYSSLISPPFFAVVKTMLTDIEDKQLRGGIAITKVNIPILKSMGVKYVLSNKILQKPLEVKREFHVLPDFSFYLYELSDINLGNYSPTNIMVAKNATEAVDFIKADNIDYSSTAITSELIDYSLSPADAVLMSIQEEHLNIRAVSSGYSLIVLPVEYSKCIKLNDNSGEKGNVIKLMRANLNQTGLLFSGNIDIAMKSNIGLFHGSACRLMDTLDMYSYGLKDLKFSN